MGIDRVERFFLIRHYAGQVNVYGNLPRSGLLMVTPLPWTAYEFTLALVHLPHHEGEPTLRAGSRDRFVPEGKPAVRIPVAGVKDLAEP